MIMEWARWLHVSNGPSAWVYTIGLTAMWVALCWGCSALLLRQKLRPPRVVILARQVWLLAGVIYIFDLAFIPVIAFNPLVIVCLVTCMVTAVLYIIRVSDKPQLEDPLASF